MQNITKSYEMGTQVVHALRGVDMEIKESEFVAIMGPSGSGKSTLMNIIGCLDIPNSGVYTIDGIDVSHMTDDEQAKIRNQRIGFVFQQFNLLPRTTAVKQVALPLMYAGYGRAERIARAEEALQAVGLGDRMDHRPDELSGGQQQRVAIARAIVAEPAIILADEPTANLDSTTAAHLLDTMEMLNREQGATFVFSMIAVSCVSGMESSIAASAGSSSRPIRSAAPDRSSSRLTRNAPSTDAFLTSISIPRGVIIYLFTISTAPLGQTSAHSPQP
jgi:putative ABC transport system ATP-binding protein